MDLTTHIRKLGQGKTEDPLDWNIPACPGKAGRVPIEWSIHLILIEIGNRSYRA